MRIQNFLFYCFLLLVAITACGRKKGHYDNTFRFSKSMVVDGHTRTYTLNLPPNYYDTSNFSLVIAMHGGGGNAEQFERTSKLTDKANAAKFIVVYPEGVRGDGLLRARTWNAGGCCDYAMEHNIDDVKFISLLIDQLIKNYKINPKKVYATGHSNGGMLSYRLACELSHKVAAIAPNAATMVVKQACNPARAVPVLHMHSMNDQHVPYTGGTGSGPSRHYNPPLDSVLNAWNIKNQCNNPAREITNNNQYIFKKWDDCSSNVSIHYYLTRDGGHAWPGGLSGSVIGDTPSSAINANDLLWAFFQQYQLP